jgi:hypothetical protein
MKKVAEMANKKEPYGDVTYGDPGYRDGVKRYPLDSEAHCRAAWAYINMPKNAAKYDAKQLKMIKDRIQKAAEKYGINIADAHTGDMAVEASDAGALLASVAPLAPPAAWFADPGLKGPTPLTIDDDGHVFGHLAQWKVCHVGIGNKCVMAPRTRTNYNLFRVGSVRTSDGKAVPIGKITLGTGHASDRWGIMPSREHYDNTGWAAAVVNVGEDRHGIWVSGSLTTTMTPERIAELRAASLSGDWREVNGNLELIAALAVNSPGFPIYREQGGRSFSLMAVGVIGQEEEYMGEEEAEFSVEEMEDATGFAAKDADVEDEEVDDEDGEYGDDEDDEEDDDEDNDEDGELSARIERWNQIEEELEEHQYERRAAQLAQIDDERMALAEKSERLAEPAGALSPTAEDDAVFIQYNARFQALAQEE